MQTRASRTSIRRRARPARRPATLKRQIKTLATVLAVAFFLGLVFGTVYFFTIFYQVSRNLPSLAEIGNFKPSEGTRIYYADGPIMAVLASENRQPVRLQDISKNLIDATIATEDQRFYEHKGVDLVGVARAVFRNVSGGDLTGQGASTITQQLARNINELGLSRAKKLRRKVAEAIIAMKLEQSYSKDEILELYLNQIYYGNGAYGAEAAAQCYFHKSSKNLSVVEAATLAGIPQRPKVYSEDIDALKRRRDWVLQRMLETRKITQSQYASAVETSPRKLPRATPRGTHVYGAPYFVNYVVAQLVNAYGPDAVYSGWRIHTTLDSRIQKAAEQTLRQGIGGNDFGANQACLVSIDPRTGYIRAMVGGLDFHASQYNTVIQGKRQPGSAFKPIVYTAAIDTGVCDLEKSYRDDPYFAGRHAGNKWLPQNYGGGYSGRYKSVLTAIKFSVNTIAVKVAMETGLDKVIEYAHRMGIDTELAKYPPLALGASAVRPIDLCSAYSVFANNGKRCIPTGVTRVVDAKDESLGEADFQVREVSTGIREETIQAMNTALQQVVLGGTGTAAADVPNAHGKTGTTSDSRDAWFAGYTPELATVIWAGHERRVHSGRQMRVQYLEMPGATGGHLCTPLWRNFMLKAVPIQQQSRKAAEKAAQARPPEREETKKPRVRPDEAKPPADAGTPANPVTPDTVEPTGPDAQPADALPGAAATPPTASPPSPGGPGPLSGSLPGGPGGVRPAPMGGAVRPPGGLPTRDSTRGPRLGEPSGRLAAPSTRVSSSDEMIDVRLCAETGMRATTYCPATVTHRMPRRSRPGFCRVHRPPPGEG